MRPSAKLAAEAAFAALLVAMVVLAGVAGGELATTAAMMREDLLAARAYLAPWTERVRRLPMPALLPAAPAAPRRGGESLHLLVGETRPQLVERERLALPVTSPVAALVESDDVLWVGTFDGGLFAMPREGEPWCVAEVDPRINDLARTSEGTLVAATNGGAYLVSRRTAGSRPADASDDSGEQGAWSTARVAEGAFTSAAVFRGRVWLASRDGLTVIEAGGARTLGPAQGIDIDHPTALRDCGEALCVGASDGLWRFDGERALHAPAGDLPADWVTAIAADRARVFVGTFDGGLAVLAREGGSRRLAPADGLPDGRVLQQGLVPLGGDALLAATASGLVLVRGGDTALYGERGLREVSALAPAEGGGVWVGLRGMVLRLALPEAGPGARAERVDAPRRVWP